MTVDWRTLILEIEPRAKMSAPTTEAEIAEAEQAVGTRFPADFRSLLLQTNGIMDDRGYLRFLMPLGNIHHEASAEPYGNGIVASTLSLRSAEFAEGNDWDSETVSMLSTFVVIGHDDAGAPFGFFAGVSENICVRYIEHDSGLLDEECNFSLEQYLRFFLEELEVFNND